MFSYSPSRGLIREGRVTCDSIRLRPVDKYQYNLRLRRDGYETNRLLVWDISETAPNLVLIRFQFCKPRIITNVKKYYI